MTITQQQLADTIKAERIRLEMTQEEVADRLDVKRSTIAQIEGGNRSVTSIELAKFAEIYNRALPFFFSETQSEHDVILHLRANNDLSEADIQNIELCIETCKAAMALESLINRGQTSDSFSYSFPRPQNRWDAVEHGIKLASMERKRLNLGALPVRNIVDIITKHGVKAGSYTLNDDVSGMFFVSKDTGKAILINAGHCTTRRLFSYAHEYAHLLVDSTQTSGAISRYLGRDDLLEIRANTFAAHFLMPEDGVREFLSNFGTSSRQVMEIFDGYEEDRNTSDEPLLTAQRRLPSGSRDLKMMDALRLAQHFGTSYIATLYQLLNLKIINKENFEALNSEHDRVDKICKILEVFPLHLEHEKVAELKATTANLILEAVLLEKIGLQKAYEYAELIQLAPDDIRSLISI